ncbi:DICT domain protein [Natronomonas moolapensis 8.8.11]|uniref:DICT domain protein n=1 Tax=Natronomonas moolapensis (strain DSM 18674 / CECT 7526 / JCM 14361 / 8.8.11) TaxID=268739 RepID=M1XNT6_NATM8|nr:diCT domain protein [Natronomonas moolapensis]CCQ35646.1 DICT domain protein [Natronomonas moolapensis 8.8.11]
MDELPASLSGFVDAAEGSERTLLLVNRTEPRPLVEMLAEAFDDQSVTVEERQIPDGPEDLVCLVADGAVVATTPLSTLEEAFLLVNVDRYRTSTRQSERGTFPEVLTGLHDVEFVVSGFPAEAKEKLLLVVISRFIEHRALTAGSGELHSTFQRLSRLDDEYGTQRMYRWLGEGDVDTHVYGIDDDPDVVDDLGVTTHAGTTDEYRRSWVVVFTPDGNAALDSISAVTRDDTGGVGLVAVEVGPNVWRSVWTYDAARVERIRNYMWERF